MKNMGTKPNRFVILLRLVLKLCPIQPARTILFFHPLNFLLAGYTFIVIVIRPNCFPMVGC